MATKLLFHTCCAPCSTHVIQELKKEHALTLFFYNPNIHPAEEYKKRLEEAKRTARLLKIPLIEGDYNTKKWFDAVKGHEEDKEGGERCRLCFALRLKEAVKFAKENSFDVFTTTLTVSPYKNTDVINKIGKELEGKYKVRFLSANFKKQDGYKKSIELSKKFKLYRQHYCGCEFSKF